MKETLKEEADEFLFVTEQKNVGNLNPKTTTTTHNNLVNSN